MLYEVITSVRVAKYMKAPAKEARTKGLMSGMGRPPMVGPAEARDRTSRHSAQTRSYNFV